MIENKKKLLTTENLPSIFGEVKKYVDAMDGCNCTGDGTGGSGGNSGGGSGSEIDPDDWEKLEQDVSKSLTQLAELKRLNSFVLELDFADYDVFDPEGSDVISSSSLESLPGTMSLAGVGSAVVMCRISSDYFESLTFAVTVVYNDYKCSASGLAPCVDASTGETVFYWFSMKPKEDGSGKYVAFFNELNTGGGSSGGSGSSEPAFILIDEFDFYDALTATSDDPLKFDLATYQTIIKKCVKACKSHTRLVIQPEYDGVSTDHHEVVGMHISEDEDVDLEFLINGVTYIMMFNNASCHTVKHTNSTASLDLATEAEVKGVADEVLNK